MEKRRRLPRYLWLTAVCVVLAFTSATYFKLDLHFDNTFKALKPNDQSIGVIAHQWIVVDVTNQPQSDVIEVPDVPGWRLLIFGARDTRFMRRRCTNCIFASDILTWKPSAVTNLKMASYVHAISHGAKWIYVTNQIENLEAQIKQFHLNDTFKGLLYKGSAMFDPSQHFGTKDVAEDSKSRRGRVSYLLGEHVTPGVQTVWKPAGYVKSSNPARKHSVACRLPHAIVPVHVFPPTNLVGSLIEYRSFWVLGSLVTERVTPSLTCWWMKLMGDMQETIGIFPPSCGNTSLSTYTEVSCYNYTQTTGNITQCTPDDSLFSCAILRAKALVKRGFLSQSDVQLLISWFDTLATLHYKEPLRGPSKKNKENAPLRPVVFEPGVGYTPTNRTVKNPFKDICKSKLPIQEASTLTDILLVVIFNYPTYYSNIVYLDYIYRKYFTSIVYCGSAMNKFSEFRKTYQRPITFVESGEIIRGDHGYLCAAYAMEMGFRVSGYLQISDDVLVNPWNIGALPRHKIWFQHSIRNASISSQKVPNITPLMNATHWWPWSSKKGAVRLNETFAHIELLKKTPERLRAVSFFQQLKTNLGGRSGGFYESSDIFYVPDRYKEDFVFFSKLCFAHRLYLEIAIPTMLCGFDAIHNIVRLDGKYLWGRERGAYVQLFQPRDLFLHPWKWKSVMNRDYVKKFFCTNYLPHVTMESNE